MCQSKLPLAFSIFVSLFLSFQLAAQDTTAYFNSNEVIKQAITLHDEEKYDEALSYYQLVHPSDSNYAWSLSEQVLTLMTKGDYEDAISLGRKGITMKSEHAASIYDLLGSSLDYNDQIEEALKVFEEGLAKYPYNRQMIYNYGVTLRNAERFEEAQKQFMKALSLEPFHTRSHLQLAELSVLQGFRAKAMISYYTYIALVPSDLNTISTVEELLVDADEDEGSIAPYSSNGYEELDAIIKAKIAVQESFKPSVKLNFKITRHAEVIVKRLTDRTPTDDFWGEFYLPFYQQLEKEKLLDAFLYTLASGVNNDDIQSWIKKNDKDIQALGNLARNTWFNYRFINPATVADIENQYEFWYYDSGKLQAIGNSDDEANPQGPWIYFYSNAEINAQGNYNMNSQKVGLWKYYYPDGTISSEETYDEQGNLTGTGINYHKNGEVASIIPYVNGVGEGLVKRYYDCGALEEEYTISNNQSEGSGIYYNPDGNKASEYLAKNGLLDGRYTTYFADGKVMEELAYKEGMREGTYTSYYDNGQVRETGLYKEDLLEGPWKGFYKNGQKQFENEYNAGKLKGQAKYYYQSGSVKDIINYDDEGNLEGLYQNYDIDEKLAFEYQYDSGRLRKYTFYDKQQKVLSTGTSNSADVTIMEGYKPTGILSFKAQLVNGMENGLTTYYHSNGKTRYTVEVENGTWNGEYLEYHDNGNLKTKTTYVDGNNTGWYEEYDEAGTLKNTGMSIDGNAEQVWKLYFPNGNISQKRYFLNGTLQGQDVTYDTDGRIFSVDIYESGKLLSYQEYDTLGQPGQRHVFPLGNGELVKTSVNGAKVHIQNFVCGISDGQVINNYENGQVYTESMVEAGSYEGEFKSYFPDGTLSTVGSYEKDTPAGQWFWYHYNGNKDTEYTYENGMLNGLLVDYYLNGQIKSSCNYIDDEKDGPCTYYSPEGELQLIKTYDRHSGAVSYQYLNKDSTLTAPKPIDIAAKTEVKAYFRNGKISRSQTYLNGVLDGKSENFSSSGQVLEVSNYKNGLQHGEQLEYYSNGQLMYSSNWKNGNEEGISKYYYPSGQLMRTVTYVANQKAGWETWYNEKGEVMVKTMYRNNQAY